MAEYQDTRSIDSGKGPDPFPSHERRPASEYGELMKHVVLGFGRWLAIVAAVAIGVRLGLQWWNVDTGRATARQVQELDAKTKAESAQAESARRNAEMDAALARTHAEAAARSRTEAQLNEEQSRLRENEELARLRARGNKPPRGNSPFRGGAPGG
jgi:hypothetical protein